MWDHVIELKVCAKKGKDLSISREEREEVYEFINE